MVQLLRGLHHVTQGLRDLHNVTCITCDPGMVQLFLHYV